jgi:hypothetical protein
MPLRFRLPRLPDLITRGRRLSSIVLASALAAVLALPPLPAVAPVSAQAADGDGLAWSIGGPGADEARAVAVDARGNVYVAGVFTDTMVVGPGAATATLTSAGDADIFLSKYAPDGNVVWAWSIGGAGSDQVYQVAVDPFGSVLIAGGFAAQVDFEPGEADASVNTGGERHGFVAKYTEAGALVWVTPVGLAGDDEILSMALDPAGNVVAAGLARISTSPGQPAAVQRGDLFALRLDGDGRLIWSAVLPTLSEGIGPVAVTVSRTGEMVLATSYSGTVRVALGAGIVDATSAGGTDILVMKLTSGGELVWARSIGGPGNEAPGTGGLALDPAGNVALTGAFDGPLDVASNGMFVLDGQGQSDLLILSLDAGGAVRWATSIGGAGRDAGQRVVTDAAQYVYVAGWFSGQPTTPAGVDGRALAGRGEGGATDGVLAKFSPDGQLAWARSIGGRGLGVGQSSIATVAALDPRGNVLVAGRFFGADAVFGMLDGTNVILGTVGQSDGFVAAFGPDGALAGR